MNTSHRVALIFLASCFFAVHGYLNVPSFSATKGTLYVSTNGKENADGSLSNPFPTIAEGISALKPGYNLEIFGGVYYVRELLFDKGISGTAEKGNQIIIRARGSDKVILGMEEPESGSSILIAPYKVSYVQLENLILDGKYTKPSGHIDFGFFVGSYSKNLVFKHIEIRNIHGQAMYIGSSDNTDGAQVPQHITIDSSFIHDCGTAPNLDHGIYASHVNNLLIVNTVLTRNKAWDIQLYPCPTNARVIHSTLDRARQWGSIVVGGGGFACYPKNILIANTIISNHPRGAIDDYGLEKKYARNVVVDTCNFFNNKGNSPGSLYLNAGSKVPLIVRNAKKMNPQYVNAGKSYKIITDYKVNNKKLNVANPKYTVRYDAIGRKRPAKGATIRAFQN